MPATTGIRSNSILFYCSDSNIELSTLKSTNCVILGLYFQSQHSRLAFDFGSTLLELIVQPNELSCTSGNEQAKRIIQAVWKTIKLALQAAKLPSYWEAASADCLPST